MERRCSDEKENISRPDGNISGDDVFGMLVYNEESFAIQLFVGD
jgi:hypothetical protein